MMKLQPIQDLALTNWKMKQTKVDKKELKYRKEVECSN